MNNLLRVLHSNGSLRGSIRYSLSLSQHTRYRHKALLSSASRRPKDYGRNKRRQTQSQNSTNDTKQSELETKRSNRMQLLLGSWMALGMWGVAMLAFSPQERSEQYTQELRTFGGKTMKRKERESNMENKNDQD